MLMIVEETSNKEAFNFETRTAADAELSVCAVCAHVSGASFHVREMLLYEASSYHIGHHQKTVDHSDWIPRDLDIRDTLAVFGPVTRFGD